MSDFDVAAHELARICVARWKLANDHAIYSYEYEMLEPVKDSIREEGWPEVDLDYDEVHDAVQRYTRLNEEEA